MDRDDGVFDWDAAFETLVAPLRPPRYRRVARMAGEALALLALMAIAGWTIVRMVGAPLRDLGRPWF